MFNQQEPSDEAQGKFADFLQDLSQQILKYVKTAEPGLCDIAANQILKDVEVRGKLDSEYFNAAMAEGSNFRVIVGFAEVVSKLIGGTLMNSFKRGVPMEPEATKQLSGLFEYMAVKAVEAAVECHNDMLAEEKKNDLQDLEREIGKVGQSMNSMLKDAITHFTDEELERMRNEQQERLRIMRDMGPHGGFLDDIVEDGLNIVNAEITRRAAYGTVPVRP